MDNINEVSPPGFSGTVRAMYTHHPEKFSTKAKGKKKGKKGKKGKMNPYAIAWSQYNKGGEAHYKPMPKGDSRKGTPKKKKKYKNEDKKSFKEWYYAETCNEGFLGNVVNKASGFVQNVSNQARLATGLGRQKVGNQPQTGDHVIVWYRRPEGAGSVIIGDDEGILEMPNGPNGYAVLRKGGSQTGIGSVADLLQRGLMKVARSGRGWEIFRTVSADGWDPKHLA